MMAVSEGDDGDGVDGEDEDAEDGQDEAPQAHQPESAPSFIPSVPYIPVVSYSNQMSDEVGKLKRNNVHTPKPMIDDELLEKKKFATVGEFSIPLYRLRPGHEEDRVRSIDMQRVDGISANAKVLGIPSVPLDYITVHIHSTNANLRRAKEMRSNSFRSPDDVKAAIVAGRFGSQADFNAAVVEPNLHGTTAAIMTTAQFLLYAETMNHRLIAVQQVAEENRTKASLTADDWTWATLVKVIVLWGLTDDDRRNLASADNAIQNSGKKMDLLEMVRRLRTAVIMALQAKKHTFSVAPYCALPRPSNVELYPFLRNSLFVHFTLSHIMQEEPVTALENRTLASLIRWSLYPRELDEEKLMEKFLTMLQKDVFDDYDTKVVSVYSIQLSGLDILKTLEVGKPWDEIHEAVKVICDTRSLSKSDIVLPDKLEKPPALKTPKKTPVKPLTPPSPAPKAVSLFTAVKITTNQSPIKQSAAVHVRLNNSASDHAIADEDASVDNVAIVLYKVKYQFDSEADDRHTNFAGFFERQMLRIAKCPTVSFEIYRLVDDHDQFYSILPTSEDIAVLQLLTPDTIDAVMKSLAKGRDHFFKHDWLEIDGSEIGQNILLPHVEFLPLLLLPLGDDPNKPFIDNQPMASLPGYETESYKLLFGYDGSNDGYAQWERLVVCNDVLITPQRNLFDFFRFRPGQPNTTNSKKSQAAFLALSSLKQWRFFAEFMMSWDRYRETVNHILGCAKNHEFTVTSEAIRVLRQLLESKNVGKEVDIPPHLTKNREDNLPQLDDSKFVDSVTTLFLRTNDELAMHYQVFEKYDDFVEAVGHNEVTDRTDKAMRKRKSGAPTDGATKLSKKNDDIVLPHVDVSDIVLDDIPTAAPDLGLVRGMEVNYSEAAFEAELANRTALLQLQLENLCIASGDVGPVWGLRLVLALYRDTKKIVLMRMRDKSTYSKLWEVGCKNTDKDNNVYGIGEIMCLNPEDEDANEFDWPLKEGAGYHSNPHRPNLQRFVLTKAVLLVLSDAAKSPSVAKARRPYVVWPSRAAGDKLTTADGNHIARCFKLMQGSSAGTSFLDMTDADKEAVAAELEAIETRKALNTANSVIVSAEKGVLLAGKVAGTSGGKGKTLVKKKNAQLAEAKARAEDLKARNEALKDLSNVKSRRSKKTTSRAGLHAMSTRSKDGETASTSKV